MGRIHIDLFTTLDGVAQAPGGPDEDPEARFPFGGWQAPLFDDLVGQQIDAGMAGMDALLLGRKTYDIFAAYWPHQQGHIATLFNSLPKYVASRGSPTLDWALARPIGTDLPNEVAALRARHEHVHVIGSIDLCQTLLGHSLFDHLTLWVYPIVLGTGKKVFPTGAAPASLHLDQPAVTSPSGTVLLRYSPLPGRPRTGDMTKTNVDDPR